MLLSAYDPSSFSEGFQKLGAPFGSPDHEHGSILGSLFLGPSFMETTIWSAWLISTLLNPCGGG